MVEVYYQLVALDGVKISRGVDRIEVKENGDIIDLRYFIITIPLFCQIEFSLLNYLFCITIFISC